MQRALGNIFQSKATPEEKRKIKFAVNDNRQVLLCRLDKDVTNRFTYYYFDNWDRSKDIKYDELIEEDKNKEDETGLNGTLTNDYVILWSKSKILLHDLKTHE